MQTELCTRRAAIKDSAPTPLSLMPHQAAGVAWLRRTPRALLADDPGLGKTAVVLKAARPPVLVVIPAMLQGTWLHEIALWRPEWVAERAADGRVTALSDDIRLVSYSSLCERQGHRVFPRARQQYQDAWATLIFDEAHYLKNRKAKWTQAALPLCESAARVFLVTGTPIPNWAHELFVPLRILHGVDDYAYRSFWRWVEKWFALWVPSYGPAGHREIGGLKAGVSWHEFAAGNELGTLMLRRRREDVLKNLPPLTEQVIENEMTAAQRDAYDELKAEYFTFVAENGAEVAALNDGGLHVKLAQATTGLGTLTHDDALLEGSGKLDALRELLVEREGAPVVVFCHFRATARLAARLGNALGRRVGLVMGGMPQRARDEAVAAFQAGRLDLLVGSLETLGEGVTLTRSATCIFVERSWRPSKNEQAKRRLHRIGQTSPVSIIYLITADSLDERMTALLAAKEREQVATLTAAQFARLL